MWNIGLESDPPSPDLEALVAGLRERAGVAEATTPAWRDALDASERFTPLAYHELHHTRTQDRETFVAYLASLAFISAMPDRDAAVERIRELARSSRCSRCGPSATGRAVSACTSGSWD